MRDREAATCVGTETKKENAVSRLDREIECSRGIAEDLATVTNKLREELIGPTPPSVATEKNPVAFQGLFGSYTNQQSGTNKILSYVLDELRTILSEIS